MSVIPEEGPATMTLTEAAAVLGIGRTLAYDLALRGEFPVRVLQLGRKRLVVRAQLEAFLAGDE